MRKFLSNVSVVARHSANRKVGVAVLLGAALAPSASAQDRSWNAGFNFWSIGGNWLPVGTPPPDATARIGDLATAENDTVFMDVDDTVAGLVVTDGMSLQIDGGALTVNGNTSVSGRNTIGLNSFTSQIRLFEDTGFELETNDLILSDAGRVEFHDGADLRVNGVLRLNAADASPSVVGHGNVELWGSGNTLVNNGQLRVLTGESLVLNQYADGSFDLDGPSGDGELHLGVFNAGTISVVGTDLADPFSGEIFLAPEGDLWMQLADGWASDGPSAIRVVGFNPPAGTFARIRGGDFSLGGLLDVRGDGVEMRFEAPVSIDASAVINVEPGSALRFGEGPAINTTEINGGSFAMASDAQIVFAGETTVDGGEFTTASNSSADGFVSFAGETDWTGSISVTGVARQLGDATVSAASAIDADVFDFDGNESVAWNVNHLLTLNIGSIDTSPGGAFNGSVNIGSLQGNLLVNLDSQPSWAMLGELTMSGSPIGFVNRLSGTPVMMGGTFALTSGGAQINSDVAFSGAATKTIADGAVLRLAGENVVESGTPFSGAGTAHVIDGGSLRMEHTATLNQVTLRNAGLLEIGGFGAGAAGAASVARFQADASGVLRVSIGGNAPGTEHDRLFVTVGEAQVGGRVEVELFDAGGGFVPVVGDEFTIISTAGGVSGTFIADPTTCVDGDQYNWRLRYGPNTVRVRLVSITPCCPADVSGDGNIDLTDLSTLLANFGLASGATHEMGDIDLDGDVDLTDLSTLLSLFGTACA
ncbi:MAG: hypothetical protein ACKVS9_15585 [Phycisphaerae bacterium]